LSLAKEVLIDRVHQLCLRSDNKRPLLNRCSLATVTHYRSCARSVSFSAQINNLGHFLKWSLVFYSSGTTSLLPFPRDLRIQRHERSQKYLILDSPFCLYVQVTGGRTGE